MHRPTPRVLVSMALVASVALSTLASCSESESTGTSLAEVPFTAADGTSTNLGDFDGTPLVVNLWATWCAPCVKEMPAFDTVADDLDGNVQLIGVNVGDSAADAVAFATELDVDYDLFTDPNGELMTALDVSGLPATAFLAADGTLLELHQGAYSESELRAAITKHFPAIGAGQP